MSIYLQLHPVSPQQRFIRQAAECLRGGGVIVYPTDSCYALGCHIGDKDALERIRTIRQTDRNHHFTLVCRDLAEVGEGRRRLHVIVGVVAGVESVGREPGRVDVSRRTERRPPLGRQDLGRGVGRTISKSMLYEATFHHRASIN